ncbi:MAG: hypothetical protein M3N19_02240 [Candidatus Eremiobacteraeota bacterium]|nr:hypothetical protein [Candidatus Eremiobacteraeota bacterium]
MMMLSATLVLALNFQVAQAPAPSPSNAPPSMPVQSAAPLPAQYVDTRGPCMDSAKQVPNVIDQPLDRASEIVRIDRVVSQATYTPNQVIGFLYTRQDGKTFLGMRTLQYTSPASAQELNAVLASTHAPGISETEFPPQTRLGVKTGYTQFFEVKLPPGAMDPLQIRLENCVAWPANRPLPDPAPGP